MTDLQTLIQEACDSAEVKFRNEYSGRGMYGRQCIGIVGGDSDCRLVIKEVIKAMAAGLSSAALRPGVGRRPEGVQQLEDAEHDFDQAIDVLMDYSMDRMGLSDIFYWPALEPIQLEENLDIELQDADLEDFDD